MFGWILWKAVLTHPLSQKNTLNGTLSTICSQQWGFVFFSNTFKIDFSLDELNNANISFYEINILSKIKDLFMSEIYL